MDAKMEKHPLQANLKRFRGELERGLTPVDSRNSVAETGKRVRNSYQPSEKSIFTSILADTQVICCTCIGAGDALLQDQYFPVVVIDEATQAVEPATLVPLCKVRLPQLGEF